MCPVNVDMATYKSEFLNDHYAGRIRPRAHYLMGWLPLLSHIAHKLPVVPRLVNWAMHAPGISTLLARAGGLDTGRPLISFAPQSLQKWASKREAHPGKERIVLWPDSFNSKLNTGPAQAGVELGDAGLRGHRPAGVRVLWPDLAFHRAAVHDAPGPRAFGEGLRPLHRGGPDGGGAGAVLHRHAPARRHHAVNRPAGQATISSNPQLRPGRRPKIAALVESGQLTPQAGSALTQVYCHEKSLGDPQQSSLILEALGYDEAQIETGCCGLAGNWGFEAGHAEMSMQLGERELFPRVREHSGPVIADGFSCRTQVSQGAGAQAVHVAEIVRDALKDGLTQKGKDR